MYVYMRELIIQPRKAFSWFRTRRGILNGPYNSLIEKDLSFLLIKDDVIQSTLICYTIPVKLICEIYIYRAIGALNRSGSFSLARSNRKLRMIYVEVAARLYLHLCFLLFHSKICRAMTCILYYKLMLLAKFTCVQ